MKKTLLSLFLVVVFGLIYLPNVALAGKPNGNCPGAPTDSQDKCLDTCNTAGYCSKDNRWMEKKCVRSVDYPVGGPWDQNGGDPNTSNVCACTYTPTKEDCGTPGGIQQKQNSVDKVIGGIKPPAEIDRLGIGATGINNILQKVIQLIYMAAGVAFVVLFLWSALQLILSGGNKEGIAAARQHITWSIIGMAMLALAFPFFRLLEGILGFKFFG